MCQIFNRTAINLSGTNQTPLTMVGPRAEQLPPPPPFASKQSNDFRRQQRRTDLLICLIVLPFFSFFYVWSHLAPFSPAAHARTTCEDLHTRGRPARGWSSGRRHSGDTHTHAPCCSRINNANIMALWLVSGSVTSVHFLLCSRAVACVGISTATYHRV